MRSAGDQSARTGDGPVVEALRGEIDRLRARLAEAERDAAAHAGALLDVGRELSSALEPADLLARLASRAASLTHAGVALVALWDPRERRHCVEGVYGVDEDRAEAVRDAGRDDGFYETGGDGPRLRRAWVARLGCDSELSVAMEWGGSVIGVLTVLWPAGREPSAGDAALAEGLAHQAAVALQNARLVADLRKASRLKSEFVATMSHELRTPLNVIMGYTDLLLEEAFGAIAPEQQNVIVRIQRSSRELFDLISATLDLNRLEAGRLDVSVERVSIPDLLADLEADTAARLDARAIEVRWELAADLPELETDGTKLRTVLKNLVGNAIKFTERGQVTITAELADGAVVFTVADTGIGIRQEDLPVIFEMFRQLESANTRRHGGVGLGLYIVKRLVEELGGEVEVDSEWGVGTRFRVRVPIRLRRVSGTRRSGAL
ncbi:MAG: hypothetical protein E6J83_10490 [Deltaproteobacteria bacterium]|nr:MAG: hypothetical protein E6J83_10490 [Deltaproteobacteria bacterium]